MNPEALEMKDAVCQASPSHLHSASPKRLTLRHGGVSHMWRVCWVLQQAGDGMPSTGHVLKASPESGMGSRGLRHFGVTLGW